MDAHRELEDALYYAALQLEGPARRLFLDQACVDNPSLRAALDEMLAAQDEAERLLERGRDALALSPGECDELVQDLSTAIETPADERIGRYRVVARLGEGGFGTVYLAEQSEPVRREVALKVIKPGMDTRRVIARFAAEQQALALMEHPNIARVLDAGVTPAGRPFFVMELVRGERITDYCDGRRLRVRERLELFIQVCLAVQHAHQKGILHRDLKPSNVLVSFQDGVATPKIIDFGVAKAVSAHAADEPVDTLAPDQFIGTPAYMSPEQAEPGRSDVDTRADIYSLGALLYELLTGRPPFDSKQLIDAGLDELRRTLREVEPAIPSALLRKLPADELAEVAARRQGTPSALTATLRRDLDWVVMRALEKDRSRRYVTVQGLALDLRHYLDHEPVVARPPNMVYQLGKCIRRYRVAFIAGTSVLLALLGGLGASSWLYLRERAALQEQTRLRAIAEDAEKISNAAFLIRDNRMEEANALLAAVRHPPDRPSFEGLTAYRTIGTWLAVRQRWVEAADRFAVVERVGRRDSWKSTTRDHQSYGVTLLMSNNLAGYEIFRRDHAERLANEDNAEAVGRVHRLCLLRPVDAPLQQRLNPPGERVERWFTTLPPQFVGWASLSVALWHYRQGDIPPARQTAALGYDERVHTSALTASKRVLLALCALSEGDRATAAPLLATAQTDIAAKFTKGLAAGTDNDGYWYDWAFARLLLDEANALAASMH